MKIDENKTKIEEGVGYMVFAGEVLTLTDEGGTRYKACRPDKFVMYLTDDNSLVLLSHLCYIYKKLVGEDLLEIPDDQKNKLKSYMTD